MTDCAASDLLRTPLVSAHLTSSGPPLRMNWPGVIFYLLIAANLIPLWALRFPSQDGPAHVYVAVVSRDYNLPDRIQFRQYFEPNNRIVPNWICPHILPYLVRVFSDEVAEKILLSFYIILLPLAVRYALRAIRPRAAALAIAAIPLVPNIYYHLGFEDFCMSLPLFFFSVGYWLKHRRDFGVRQTIVLAGLLLLSYLAHIVGAAMAGMFLVLLACTMGQGGMKARLRRLLPVVAAGLPAIILTLSFMVAQHGEKQMHGAPDGLMQRIKEVVSWQKAFANREVAPVAINIAMFAGVSFWLLLRRRPGRRLVLGIDAFLLIAGVCALLFFLMPDAAAGGALLVVRLIAFGFFGLLLWWGSLPIGSDAFARLIRVITPVSACVTILMLVSMTLSYIEFDPYRREIEQAVSHVASNSTLFSTRFSPATLVPNSGGRWISRGPDPLQHAAYPPAADRGIVMVDCMPATTNYQPLKFRPGLSPGPDGLEDYDAYEAQVGRPIDYILLWTGGGGPDDENDRKLVRELDREYELVFTSPRTGYAKLYRNKNLDSLQRQAAGDTRQEPLGG